MRDKVATSNQDSLSLFAIREGTFLIGGRAGASGGGRSKKFGLLGRVRPSYFERYGEG